MRTIGISSKTALSGCKRQLLSAAGIIALSIGMQQAAHAQDSSGIETVTVTSSRVQRAGYSAPTPVTSVSTEELQQEAASNLGEVLNNMPSFAPSSSPTTSGVNSLNGGQVSANLRGLGSSRTLVLVNGKRFTPADSSGGADLTQIPTLLVKRVEVVTGGGSAAYGSDAVTGIINFQLDNTFEGYRGSLQYGTTGYGDDNEIQAAAAYGAAFLGDKLHVTVGVNFENNDGVLGQYTRPWGRKEVGLITNGAYATNGLPNFIISASDHTSAQTASGIITAGPLKGTAFGPGGVTHTFQYGTVFGSSMIGGEQETPNPTLNSYLGKPFTASIGLAHVEYAITPDIKAFFDISGGRTGAGGASQQSRDTALVIHNDNAYLAQSVKTSMATNKITTFTLGRYYDDVGPIQLRSGDKNGRAIGGFEGKFDALGSSWNWDASYQFAQNHYKLQFGPNNRNQANFLLAADAVTNPAGQIVCRSTLTSPNNGCIPVNVFGNGSETVNNFVNGSATYDIVTEQNVADVDLNGAPFSTWAGEVSVATGAEWRRENARAIADPVSIQVNADGSTGGWALGNQKSYSGAFDVYEGYGELVVPILAESSGIGKADINTAVRLTSYSTSGGVTTWKFGINYSPIDDLRFRATRSHDIRAPNLGDLYQGGTGSSYTSVFDYVLGQTVQVRQVGSGNVNLKPEKAETWTAGFVYQPNWLSGFGMSLDYYNIKMTSVISSVGVATINDNCHAGQAQYCAAIAFNPNGTLNYINSISLNLNSLKTSGVDFEASYNMAAEDIWHELDGTITGHILTSFIDDRTTVLPGGIIQRTLGQLSAFNRTGGVPKWQGNADITYDFQPFSLNARVRYIGGGLFGAALHDGAGAANTIAKNEISDIFYLNLGGTYSTTIADVPTQFFLTINNVLDIDPPALPSGAAGGTNESSTNTSYYDALGRLFRFGIRIRN